MGYIGSDTRFRVRGSGRKIGFVVYGVQHVGFRVIPDKSTL